MSLLAHGGTAGLIVEVALVVLVAAFFVAAWLRTRSAPGDEAGVEEQRGGEHEG